MRASDMFTHLRAAGPQLTNAAADAGMDAPVPTCPDWHVRDLLFHQGAIHRWATRYVHEALPEPIPRHAGGDPLRDADERPSDATLADWLTEGHTTLMQVLTDAPDDLQCWTFLPAPTPLAFWTRRQLHETTVHRVDAELAGGQTHPVADAAVATDGIDELLTGFLVRRRHKLRSDQPTTIGVHATDTDAHWHLTVSADPVVAERADRPADATMRGLASDVFLTLWNRLPLEALDITGQRALVDRWPELARI